MKIRIRKMILLVISLILYACLFATTLKEFQYPQDRTTRALWDPLMVFDAESDTYSLTINAVEWDGSNFHVNGFWGHNYMYRFDAQGNYVDYYEIPNMNIKDTAFDGTYMYGAYLSTVHCWNPSTGNAVQGNYIDVEGHTLRALAYDEVTDTFWSGNWGDDIINFNRDGEILSSYPWDGALYGLAYDNDPHGPFLYAHSQDPLCMVYKLDPANDLEVVDTFDSSTLGPLFCQAGGACVMNDWDSDHRSLAVVIMANPAYVAILDLGWNLPVTSPGELHDVSIVPDPNGLLEAEILWTCPTVDFVGNELTDIDEVRIYNNNVLIYTDTEPVIGESNSYVDSSVLFPMNCTYRIVGYNDSGEGVPVEIMVRVGEDVPNYVENLNLEADPPGTLTGTLTWENPTFGLNGGILLSPILGYHIVRSDAVAFEVSGIVTEFVDDTVSEAGAYSYTVQPFNTWGNGGIASSDVVLISEAGLLVDEDFSVSVPPFGWEIQGINYGNWQQLDNNIAGGESPEVLFSSAIPLDGFTALTTMPLNTTGANSLHLEFKHAVDNYLGGYTVGVKTTSNGGLTWNDVVNYEIEDHIMPEEVVMDFTTPDVGSENCQVGFFFDGYIYWLYYWYIDDVLVSMNLMDPGTIEGQVTLNGGDGQVEDVLITAGNYSTNPDAEGYYSIEVPPFTYEVTATLADYADSTVSEVTILEGQATTNIDFALDALFYSPGNLDIEGYELTWDAAGTLNGTCTGFEEAQVGIFPPTDWMLLSPDGGTGWMAVPEGMAPIPGWIGPLEITSCPDGGVAQAYCTWSTGGATYNDQWIVSPKVTIQEGDVLDFWMILYVPDYSDHLELRLSTNSQNDVSDFDIVVDELDFDSEFSDDWENHIYLLSDYVEPGTQVYVAFREFLEDNSSYGNAIAIDNIKIGDSALTIDNGPGDAIANSSRNDKKGSTRATRNPGDRALTGYNVYLDDELHGFTEELSWTFENADPSIEHLAGVESVYEDGISDRSVIRIGTYNGGASEDIVPFTTLSDNYPNPFNPTTTIKYSLSALDEVSITVYNIKGQKVKTLVDDKLEAGCHNITWNGDNDCGKKVSSGVYFYKMKTSSFSKTKKMLLLK